MVKCKESESESEGAEHAAEPRFRVRVCMQRFYREGDVRARAYVSVAPRRRVRWLQRRLRRLFALPPVRLLSRGHLLPPQERLALLQPDDPVEVVPVEAEPGDAAAAQNVVDCVDEAQVTTVVEPERSPPPSSPEGLTETKRQALMMLEQYCAEPAAEGTTNAPRPRRRRVRRRRRVPPGAALECSPSAALERSPSAALERSPSAALERSLSAARERSPSAVLERLPSAALERSTSAALEHSSSAALEGSPSGPLVLRNSPMARAPRVVRPLADRLRAAFLDSPPADIVTC